MKFNRFRAHGGGRRSRTPLLFIPIVKKKKADIVMLGYIFFERLVSYELKIRDLCSVTIKVLLVFG